MAKFLGPQFVGPFPRLGLARLGAPLFVFFCTFFLSRVPCALCIHRSARAAINFWLYRRTNYPSWLCAKTALRFIWRQSVGDADMVQKRQKGEYTEISLPFFPVCLHFPQKAHTHTEGEGEQQAANIRKTIMALLLTISASALWA